MSVMVRPPGVPDEPAGVAVSRSRRRALRAAPSNRPTVSSVCCGDGPLGPVGGECRRQRRRGRSTDGVCSLRRSPARLRARGGSRSPRCRGGRRAPASCRATTSIAGRRPAVVRKHLSSRRRPTRPGRPLSSRYRSPVWYSELPPDAPVRGRALCRRIGSPARSGVVAGVAAHPGRRRRADADAAHRRAACLAGTFAFKANLKPRFSAFSLPSSGLRGRASSRPAGRGTLLAEWRSNRAVGARRQRHLAQARAGSADGRSRAPSGEKVSARRLAGGASAGGVCGRRSRASAWAAGRRSPSTSACRCRRRVRTAGPTCWPARTSRVRPHQADRRSTRRGSGLRSADDALDVSVGGKKIVCVVAQVASDPDPGHAVDLVAAHKPLPGSFSLAPAGWRPPGGRRRCNRGDADADLSQGRR